MHLRALGGIPWRSHPIRQASTLARMFLRSAPWALAPAAALLVLTATPACSHISPYRGPALATPERQFVERPLYSLLLVGDAGEPGAEAATLVAVRAWVDRAADRTLVTFLGDNAYPEGLTGAHRREAERSLLRQLEVVADTSAQALFIPGNHDWADGGPEGLDAVLAQAAFVGGRARFLPSNGCPGPEVLDLPETEPHVRLVVLDTQWWLQGEGKPTDDCTPGTPEAIVRALGDALATDLTVVIAAHHPLATHGPHGGFFDWRAHIFPLTHLARWLWVPLPGVGSLYPLARTHLMPSNQELSNGRNRAMRTALSEALASRIRRGPVLYASGHEHSLQVLRGDVVDYLLVSGAASQSKITAVGSGPDTLFAHEHAGFMVLDVWATGMRLSVVEPTGDGGSDVAFAIEIPR